MNNSTSTVHLNNVQLGRIDLSPTKNPSETIVSPTTRPAKFPVEPQTSIKPQPKADAPFTKLGRFVTAGIHFAVLTGLVAFVVHQLYRSATVDRRRAVVTVVAPNLQQISSPVDGVFRAVRHLPKGTLVQQGDVLGHIVSATHQANLERTQARLTQLLQSQRQIKLGGRNRPDFEEAMRDVTEKVEMTKVELKFLTALSEQLCIKAPFSGYVEHGLSGSLQVTRDAPIAFLWQEGDQLLIEVKAPLELIHKLVCKGTFCTRFTTADGDIQASVVPITTSLKPIYKESSSKGDELWGLIQCQPTTLPPSIAFPGAMGRL